MVASTNEFQFHGEGDTQELEPLKAKIRPWKQTFGPWMRRRGEAPIPDDANKPPEHPANYAATSDLADAVNTAIALGKPLLVTGSPGTGKSQLAERIAWELNLGHVLRFEAQSLSEANDLFYRFDLVGYLSDVEVHKTSGGPRPLPKQFVKLGPLGEAIVRSDPTAHAELFNAALAPEVAENAEARPSVVLIDEIDKASRDFPNDLLNGIERREFAIREMKIDSVVANPSYPPIVLITSNSERDLPAPFLRRCTFFHIADPTQETLRDILIRKFFPWVDGIGGGRRKELPPFYAQLLDHFWSYRDSTTQPLQYAPGTSELIDWTQALIKRTADPAANLGAEIAKVKQTASSVAKHRDDLAVLIKSFKKFEPRTT
jgi:MoxR-like ATPase